MEPSSAECLPLMNEGDDRLPKDIDKGGGGKETNEAAGAPWIEESILDCARGMCVS